MFTDSPQQLDEFAVAHLKRNGAMTGEHLYGMLTTRFPNLPQNKFADLVERLAEGDQIEVYDERASSVIKYLTAWEKHLWFYLSLITTASTVLAAYLIPSDSFFMPIRLALGLPFVLLLPGYVALQALFPAADLHRFDRVALSIGVSLVLDIFSGVLLNYSPWGIQLVSILSVVGTFTISFAILALLRQFELARQGVLRITL
ncbi:MAG: DUF1616 domain-containing protein [Candidatus Bathyarchaeia archaeon]